jgi:hypothetical protein
MPSPLETKAERGYCTNHKIGVDSAKALGVSTALKRSRITDYEEAPP